MKVFTTTMLAAVALFVMATLFTPQAKADPLPDPTLCAIACIDSFFNCQLGCIDILDEDPFFPGPNPQEEACLNQCQWNLFTCQNACGT